MIAAVPAHALETMRPLAPAEVELRATPPPGEDVGPALAGASFLVPASDRRDLVDALAGLDDLEVVQALSAGVDWLEAQVPAHVTLCSARGARDVSVAEWVVGVLLGCAHGLFGAALAQAERRWAPYEQDELAGRTVLVVGMGSIGEAVRRRLAGLDVEVVGVARHARPGVAAIDALDELLPRADAVVLLTPLTPETRRLVDARFLTRLPDGALLVNAARGAVVDTDALLAELGRGRLRAALDVTDPEPLPPEHPLWRAPGVFLTPHVAGDSPQGERRAERFAAEQIARHARGEPLENVIER